MPLVRSFYKHIYNNFYSIYTITKKDNEKLRLILDKSKNIIIDCLCRIEKNILQKRINHLRLTLKNDALNGEGKLKNLEEIAKYQKKKNNLIEKYQDA